MSACCCSLAGTAACQTCSQNPFAVMSKMMTPQPTALRDIIVNLQTEKPMTNADHIRSMTDEELAIFFGTLPCCPPGNAGELCFPDNTCGADTKMMIKCWENWLKDPAEEEE